MKKTSITLKKLTDKGPSFPRNNMVVSSLGFLFALYSQGLDLRGNKLEMLSGHRQNKSQQKPALPIQRTRRGVDQQDRKLLDITSLFQPNTTEKLWPHLYSCQQRLNGEPRFLPWPCYNKVFSDIITAKVVAEKAEFWDRTLIHAGC